jgi:hypothetical protein
VPRDRGEDRVPVGPAGLEIGVERRREQRPEVIAQDEELQRDLRLAALRQRLGVLDELDEREQQLVAVAESARRSRARASFRSA